MNPQSSHTTLSRTTPAGSETHKELNALTDRQCSSFLVKRGLDRHSVQIAIRFRYHVMHHPSTRFPGVNAFVCSIYSFGGYRKQVEREFEAMETQDRPIRVYHPAYGLRECLGILCLIVLDRGSKIPFREKKEVISLIGRERSIERCSRVG
jgi:hypothetical protein